MPSYNYNDQYREVTAEIEAEEAYNEAVRQDMAIVELPKDRGYRVGKLDFAPLIGDQADDFYLVDRRHPRLAASMTREWIYFSLMTQLACQHREKLYAMQWRNSHRGYPKLTWWAYSGAHAEYLHDRLMSFLRINIDKSVALEKEWVAQCLRELRWREQFTEFPLFLEKCRIHHWYGFSLMRGLIDASVMDVVCADYQSGDDFARELGESVRQYLEQKAAETGQKAPVVRYDDDTVVIGF